jgi:hypothetical protein
MELDDIEGNEILRIDANGECVTEVIEAGDYVMTIHHDGRNFTTHPIFMIPNPDDIQEARERDGLIDRFKVVIANIQQNIQDTVSKDARAQSASDDISTLISTNRCVRCNLFKADLSNRVLNLGVLTESSLRFAKLNNSKLHFAALDKPDLYGANLSGAETDLRNADFGFANLNTAKLIDANLSGADLSFASLNVADLSGANLIGATLDFSILSGARWCDGKCGCVEFGQDGKQASIGTCAGCPPQDTCTGP